MPVTKLKELLDAENVKYVTIGHSEAYTAHEIAASAHIPGDELAKVVIVKIAGSLAMAVLPSSHMVHVSKLKHAVNAGGVEIAEEQEFKDRFPDCEVGAMPPFGNLYGMDVYVEESLTKDEHIAFNAGSHRELIKLPYKDFDRLVQPRVISF